MTLFGPDWPKRWNPLFTGRAVSFLPPNDPPCWRLLFETCPRFNERAAVPVLPRSSERVGFAVLLRAEKKCWFCETLRIVDGAAGRPLAEKLSRLGVTGSLPVVKRAFWNCW